MTFKEHKIDLINQVEKTSEFHNDRALRRVVELLKSINSVEQLRKEKGRIDRICIDSVENWDSIETILSFTSNYSKTK